MSDTSPIPNIFQRINAVMKAVKGVSKDATNSHGGYKYAGHEALTEALRGKYVENGIVRSASIVSTHREGGLLQLTVEVSFVNVDNPTDRHVVMAFGESPTVTKSNVASPVQVGIALSYAVKNAEFKLFAVTGDDSPDAEQTDKQTVEAEVLKDMLLDRYAFAESRAEVDGVTNDVRKNRPALRGAIADLLTAREKAEARFPQ